MRQMKRVFSRTFRISRHPKILLEIYTVNSFQCSYIEHVGYLFGVKPQSPDEEHIPFRILLKRHYYEHTCSAIDSLAVLIRDTLPDKLNWLATGACYDNCHAHGSCVCNGDYHNRLHFLQPLLLTILQNRRLQNIL